jgi:hypothetical protein
MSDATLSKLRDATIFGRLFYGPTDGTSVAGRSIAWKVMEEFCFNLNLILRLPQLFLSKEEPLQSSLPPRSTALLDSLCESRNRYADLLKENLRAPDGSPDELPSSQRPQRTVRERVKDLNLNNPLSLHDEVHYRNILNFYF